VPSTGVYFITSTTTAAEWIEAEKAVSQDQSMYITPLTAHRSVALVNLYENFKSDVGNIKM
jgi:hypothetical protein